MTDKTYRQAFEQAKVDLDEALAKRNHHLDEADKAQTESVQFRRAVAALAILCGENVEDSMGLTEAVRIVFHARKQSWTAAKDVRAQVEGLGVSLSDLKNPEASLLSVLNRLTTAGELQTAVRKDKGVTGATVDVKVWRTDPNFKRTSDTVAAAAPITDDDIPF